MAEKFSDFEGLPDEGVDEELGSIDMGPDVPEEELEVDPETGLPLSEVGAAGLHIENDGEKEEE